MSSFVEEIGFLSWIVLDEIGELEGVMQILSHELLFVVEGEKGEDISREEISEK